MTNSTIASGLTFDNSYANQLEGFFAPFSGETVPAPKLIKLNQQLADELGLDTEHLLDEELAKIFSGSVIPEGAAPIAQVYAGHQFGRFSPQLGDGRALLLGEVIDCNGDRRDIHLKGSGRTPFSRGGDGKAVLGPMLREYLLGEAMQALNVPTTRALAVVATGEEVFRGTLLPGAVLARVAASHIRVGTFEYFASQGDSHRVKQLADYSITRHFPALTQTENPYLQLLCGVRDRQAYLLARWMQIGFIHGVMNTDNMTISGETIDYGPCAFMDSYDLATVFSSIDEQGRYAYGNQPPIAQWNLARLAEALLPLIDDNIDTAVELVTAEIKDFSEIYQQRWLEGMRLKLGLSNDEAEDLELANSLLNSMDGQDVDFTNLFRSLSDLLQGDSEKVYDMFDNTELFDQWVTTWTQRLSRDPMPTKERIVLMNSVNPIYIPRNHKIEEALQAAEKDSDFAPFEKLLEVFKEPFTERTGLSEFAQPAPDAFLPYKTFCGT